MTVTDSNDISFLYPHLFAVDQTVSDVNADLTRALTLLDTAIAAAENDAPHIPELPLLRARRQQLRKFQHAVLGVSEHFQAELESMESGFAASAGLTECADWNKK